MTAPCPTFGFSVALKPRPDLSPSDRHALWTAWTDFLERCSLYCERRGGADRMECVVLRDGAQATDSDRTLVRGWLAERADLAGWTMGDLEDLKEDGGMSGLRPSSHATPRLTAAHPQLFVSNVRDACEFYTRVLGFTVVFVHGDPPFYAQVARDGIALNLRHVDTPVFDDSMRQRDRLLSAYIEVVGVSGLHGQFEAAGAEFPQPLQRQPWGTQDFIVRDPDGNLLCFAE